MSYYIVGVRMDNRVDNAVRFQEVLTKNGCGIRARLGLHQADADECANDGLILLQPSGEKNEVEGLVSALNALEGLTAKYMDLNH